VESRSRNAGVNIVSGEIAVFDCVW